MGGYLADPCWAPIVRKRALFPGATGAIRDALDRAGQLALVADRHRYVACLLPGDDVSRGRRVVDPARRVLPGIGPSTGIPRRHPRCDRGVGDRRGLRIDTG